MVEKTGRQEPAWPKGWGEETDSERKINRERARASNTCMFTEELTQIFVLIFILYFLDIFIFIYSASVFALYVPLLL